MTIENQWKAKVVSNLIWNEPVLAYINTVYCDLANINSK